MLMDFIHYISLSLLNDRFVIIAVLIRLTSHCTDTAGVYAEITRFSFMNESAVLGEMQ